MNLESEGEYLVELHRTLSTRFDEGELRTLCFGLGVEYQDLPGDGRSNKARELILYLDRRRRVPELLKLGKDLRPDVDWWGGPSEPSATSSGFWYYGPLPPESPLFRGRVGALDKIKALCEGELRSYLIIFGGRQVGKTSLLYRVPVYIGERHVVCRLDLQSLSGATPQQVYGHIAGKLGALVHSVPSLSPELDSIRLSDLVLQMASQMRKGKLVLLFEELGSLPIETAIALANLLRSWFNERFDPGRRAFGRVMVVLAGSVELYQLAAVDVSPLRNVSEVLYLSGLEEGEAVGLIVEGLSQLNVSPDQSRRLGQAVFALVHGHPYLTQRIGDEIEVRSRAGLFTKGDIPQLAYEALMTDDPLVQHLRRALDELQLWASIPDLLSGCVRYSRHDKEMALLELLGLAIEREGCWVVQNAFFKRILREWQGVPS